MQAKHAIVIDKQGYKVTFVLVDFIEENGKAKEIPRYYTLNDSENLIYADIPTGLSMIKPRWDDNVWVETATSEEIAAAKPEPVEHQPNETDIIMLAVAELYEKFEKALGGVTT